MSKAPKEMDHAVLQAELAAERQRRVALEARLAELEKSLEAMRGGPEKAADELAAFSLHHAPATEADSSEERAALDLWLLESELRIEDRERAERITTAPLPILVEQAPRALSEKLAATSLAMEAAEQRAQHNAQQVKRLTEELMSARAEQIRTASRLRELEERLLKTEHQAGAYPPPAADWPRPDHSLPLPLEEAAAPPTEETATSSIEDELMRVAFEMRAPADRPRDEHLRETRKLPVFEEFELPGGPSAAPVLGTPPTEARDAVQSRMEPAPLAEAAETVPATDESVLEEATASDSPVLPAEAGISDENVSAMPQEDADPAAAIEQAQKPETAPALNLEDALALWSTEGALPTSAAPEESPATTTTPESAAEYVAPVSPGLSLEEALAEFSASASAPRKTPTPAAEDTATWQPLIDEVPDQEDSFITPSIAGLPGDWQDGPAAPTPSAAPSAPQPEEPHMESIDPLETPAPVNMAAELSQMTPDTTELKSGEVFEIEVIDEHTPLPPTDDKEENQAAEAAETTGVSIGIEDLEAAPLPPPQPSETEMASEAAPMVPASDLLEPVPDFEAEQGLLEESATVPAEENRAPTSAPPLTAAPDEDAYLKPLPDFVSEVESGEQSRPPVSIADLEAAAQTPHEIAANAAPEQPAARPQSPIAASARDGAGMMAESLRAWGGMKQPAATARKPATASGASAPPRSEAAAASDESPSEAPASSKGRKGMVEALMRFMGPR